MAVRSVPAALRLLSSAEAMLLPKVKLHPYPCPLTVSRTNRRLFQNFSMQTSAMRSGSSFSCFRFHSSFSIKDPSVQPFTRFVSANATQLITSSAFFSASFSSSATKSSSSSSSSSSSTAKPPVVLSSISELRSILSPLRRGPLPIGLVPTMGALHSGHLELVRAAKQSGHLVVVSIFVNPTQFLPGEDFTRYPRQLEQDLSLLSTVGADFVFAPKTYEEIYPKAPPHAVWVDVEGINAIGEGRVRPGHFRGVCTVVSKLFNIVQPVTAFFGQKDGLQCIAIRRLIHDLNVPVRFHMVPTVRASDGLALSSRNVYLSSEERILAALIYQALFAGQSKWIKENERNVQNIIQSVKNVFQPLVNSGKITIQYISISSTFTGEEYSLDKIIEVEQGASSEDGGAVMLATAIGIGKLRLLDNVLLPFQPKKMKDHVMKKIEITPELKSKLQSLTS